MQTIPAGTYNVGSATPPELIQPPQRGYIKTPTTPPASITLEAFDISTDIIRGRDVRHMSAYDDVADGEAIRVHYEVAEVIAASLQGRLPTRQEWEVAARGAEGRLYPWGDTVDRDHLELTLETYSVDESSTMGYYDYSEELYYIESFGAYADTASPFGLVNLVRAGREWNAGAVQRSLSDLGGMWAMIPGNRPRTYDSGGYRARQQAAFSGPSLVHYTDDIRYEVAAFRVVRDVQV